MFAWISCYVFLHISISFSIFSVDFFLQISFTFSQGFVILVEKDMPELKSGERIHMGKLCNNIIIEYHYELTHTLK